MSLANGRPHLAIPGPSVMPDRVLRAMHRAAPNIYEGALVDMVPGIVDDLRSFAGTSGEAAIYIGNGHAVWEAALANVLSRGDEVLVLATGTFAHGWAEMAKGLHAKPTIIDFPTDAALDPERVRDALAADKGHRFKAVLMVQVDTSTSVRNDVAAVSKVLKETGHPALLMADCIASFGCDVFDMDQMGADVMVTASQKGLMTPPGVGFVFFNERAAEAREQADCVTHYWDWRPRVDPGYFSQYFDGTAPTHHLYGLREALDMIAEEGRAAIWERHALLAQSIWAAVAHWGKAGSVSLNVPEPSHRSHAVTTVYAGSSKAATLRRWVETRAGLTLGIGLRLEPSDHYFRIGHMGHVNAHMILGTLATIEAGMKAVGIDCEPGGASAAAEVVSRA